MLKRVVHSLGLVDHTDDNNNKKKGSTKSKKKVGRSKGSSSSSSSPQFSSRSKDFVVTITHAGGQQEVYRHAVPASKLMTKYPGMCVARPEVFKVPHQSVLWREDLLLPGHKYILISFKAVEKLKHKHPEAGQTKEPNGVVTKVTLDHTKAKSPSGHKHKENGSTMKVPPNGVVRKETLDDAEIIITRSPNGKMKEANGVARVDESSLGVEVQEESFVCAKDFYLPKEKSTRCSSRRRVLRAKKPFVPPLPKARHYRSLGWQPSLPTVKELSP